MKFTAVLFRRPSRVFRRKVLYQTKGLYQVLPLQNTDLLDTLGKEVVDVTSPNVSKHLADAEKAKVPPSKEKKPKLGKRFLAGQGPIYVDVLKEKKYKVPWQLENADTQTVEVCHLTTHERFTEGIDQACLLTKTLRTDELAPPIAEAVGEVEIPDQDELIQRLILQSQVWDNSAVMLGRRLDKRNIKYRFKVEYGIPNSKSAKILIHNFIRLAMHTASTHPGVVNNRHLLYKPNLETAYWYKDNLIRVNAVNECMIVGKKPLKPIVGWGKVESSEIPDMFPINPTIDLERVQIPTRLLTSQGAFKEGLSDRYPKHPHIIFRSMNFNWRPEVNQAYNLMLCFATAITEARARFGIKVNFDNNSAPPARLPEPIVIHNVNTDWHNMNFITFQLNTVDLSTDSGIKNKAWFDSNTLFHRELPQPWKGEDHLRTWYSKYDPEVFQKFLAVFLQGVNKGNNVWKEKPPAKKYRTSTSKWFK